MLDEKSVVPGSMVEPSPSDAGRLPTDPDLHGTTTVLRRVPGIHVLRVEHRPRQRIEEHIHDWPCLTFFRCGAYVERIDEAEVAIHGPALAFHPAGCAHANAIGTAGLETLSVVFDPAVLAPTLGALHRQSRIWQGGSLGRTVTRTVRYLLTPALDPAQELCNLFEVALAADQRRPQPHWLPRMRTMIAQGTTSTAGIAKLLGLHPGWLARAYLQATGESIQELHRRRRVERALGLIRTTADSLATIAAEVGFCDQSHMARAFNAVLGRPPSAVRDSALTGIPGA
ncbi:AraC family transcriptional regulator [Sphingomonas sp. UYAg733]